MLSVCHYNSNIMQNILKNFAQNVINVLINCQVNQQDRLKMCDQSFFSHLLFVDLLVCNSTSCTCFFLSLCCFPSFGLRMFSYGFFFIYVTYFKLILSNTNWCTKYLNIWYMFVRKIMNWHEHVWFNQNRSTD